jgi:plastocyanin
VKQLVSGLTIALALVVSSGCGGGSSGSTGLQPGTNGCTSFTDATAPGASRVINFGGNLGNAYDPKCLAIAANQQVTFNGSFTTHPLRPGLAPSQSGGTPGSPNNPIQSTSSGSSAPFAFVNAGTYPYYCSAHESLGMFGAIQVR